MQSNSSENPASAADSGHSSTQLNASDFVSDTNASAASATGTASTDSTASTTSTTSTPGNTAQGESTVAATASSSQGDASNGSAANHKPTTLKLKLGPKRSNEEPRNEMQRVFSLRRSERMRNQALKAEETRRIREARAAIEESRAKARSIAAKKAAATKRAAAKKEAALKAAEAKGIKIAPKPKDGSSSKSKTANSTSTSTSSAAAAAGNSGGRPGSRVAAEGGVKKGGRPPRYMIKLRYFNHVVPPTFTPVDLGSTTVSVFWLRTNLREFLYRFDKLCRVPAKLTAGLNDPLEPWTPEQFKVVAIGMLKLIANDAKPLHEEVRAYIAEIEALEPSNPRIWDWLLQFVEQLDAYAPQEVPTTEEEQLDLLRRLLVICTGTETIRITVMSDVEQLKWVEKDAQEEIKTIGAKLKDTEQKLVKFKTLDKDLHAEKVAAAQRSAANKVWKAQQQLFVKLHKYNMRTAPIAEDPHGNKYWSLQYKSPSQAAWGSWIICEMRSRPTELAAWHQRLSSDVTKVLRSRDLLIAEKNEERRKMRKEEKKSKDLSSPPANNGEASNGEASKGEASNGEASAVQQSLITTSESAPASALDSAPDSAPDSAKNEGGKSIENGTSVAVKAEDSVDAKRQPKRRYPKLKINQPEKLEEPELYIVEGKENIKQLAKWIAGFVGMDKKVVAEIESVATYLAPDE